MTDSLLQDLRYAARWLRKRRGFTAVAVLTLALGIGANTAMFSVIEAIYLRPLPFPQSDAIYVVRRMGNRFGGASVSMPIFLEWQKSAARLFQHLALFESRTPSTVTGRGEPERIATAAASSELFDVLNVRPAIGRTFLAEESRFGGSNVAIVTDRLWRRYGADRGIVGSTITINDVPHTIVGVLASSFDLPLRGASEADLWIPIRVPATSSNPSNGGLLCLGRLRSDVTPAQAEEVLTRPLADLRQRFPDMFVPTERASLRPLHEFITAGAQTVPLLIGGAVALVLLIACLNVANLSLAVATGREREIAVRTAVGAARARIVRQMLTESVLVAVMGGVAGVAVCYVLFDAIIALVPATMPHVGPFAIDGTVLLFSLALSVLTGLLFGLAPALSSSRLDSEAVLKNANPRSGGMGRLRPALAINEIAICLVLLIGAALAMQSFQRLARVEPGFDATQLLTFRIVIPVQRYPTDAARQTFFDAALARIATLPGVQRAAVTNVLPFQGGGDMLFTFEDGGPGRLDRAGANVRRVSPEYFGALRMPIHAGRAFSDRDAAGAVPVAIINRAMARAYWPDRDPIGQHVWIGRPMGPANSEPAPREIVGIVGDIRDTSLAREPMPTLYIPFAQSSLLNGGTFVLRTAVPPLNLTPDVRRTIRTLDPELPIAGISEMEDVVALSTSDWRFRAILLAAFGAVAMLIAAIGVYGVIAYSVAQRTQEIGVRLALGALRRDVLLMVLRHGMRTSLIGIGIGLAAAFALTRVMSGLLFGITATDPVTFAGIALLLALVALAACVIPARRAMNVEAFVALKSE